MRPSHRLPCAVTIPLLLASSACTSAPPPAPKAPAAAAAAQSAPVKPGAEVIWKHRLGHEELPQVSEIATNAAGDLLFAGDMQDGALLFRFGADLRPRFRATLADSLSLGGLALDAEGNAYVAGSFKGTLTMSGKPLSTREALSLFLMKLDGEGKNVWLTVFEGNNPGNAILHMAPSGQLFLAGGFGSGLKLGGTTLAGGGNADYSPVRQNLFLAELTTAGSARWAREVPGEAFVSTLLMDGAGKLLFAGDFWGPLHFDPQAPMRVEPWSSDRGSYLAKLDATGHLLWTRHIGATEVAAVPGPSGDVYICGGPWKRWGPSQLIKLGGDGRVVFKLDMDKQVDMIGCRDVATDDKGMAIVIGERQIGEPDAKSGGITTAGRLLRVDGEGKVTGSLDLPEGFTMQSPPRIVWSKGRLYAAGVSGTYQDPSFFLAELTL